MAIKHYETDRKRDHNSIKRAAKMFKDIVDKYYYAQDYNCAEIMIHAANEYYDLKLHDRDMIMLAGFGGGMQTGNTCGAILAAISILSMKYVGQRAHDSKDIRPVTTALIREFNTRYGSLLCKDIKPQLFDPKLKCKYTIEAACDILEEVIADHEG